MKVQHNFTTEVDPAELGDLKLEAEGLRDYGIVYDPNNPRNCALITIWDDLEAARNAASRADFVTENLAARAAPSGGETTLYVSPRGKGSAGTTETGSKSSY
jgi:hypothetical protein